MSGKSVSHSAVESYTLCRRKYYYGYVLGIERVQESASLTEGSLGHATLEVFYKTILKAGNKKANQKKAVPAALKAAEEFFDSADYKPNTRRRDLRDTLFEHYFPHEQFVAKGYQILAVEKKFKLYYDDEGSSLPFVIDLIVKDPRGKTVIVDHKFMYNFISHDEAELMPQIPKYIAGVRALGLPADYGMYNMLRTRKDAKEVCDTMKVRPSKTRIERSFVEQIGVASEIIARQGLSVEEQEATSYRTANKMVCQSCSFKFLCSEELSGGNVEMSLRTEYKKRERSGGAFDGKDVIHN